ncbi:MAG: DUF2380 domain-containing protein [Candidatus Marinimicrobia bacterium]|nr:DUF2380 domain-containing protein [Candidatus Neomarinimicrobiota bacterium]
MKKKFVLGLILLFSTLIYAQISVAVLDLEGKGLTELEASILTDRLRHELFQTGRYRVVERDMMGEIIDEQGFQLSECTSTECMVEIGRLLGVDQMVGGSVSKFGSMYSISVRLINVETGEILGTATYDHEGRIEDLLKYGMRVVSNELSGMKDEESIIETDIITEFQEPVKQPEPKERAIVAQEQIKDVQKQPVTQPASLPKKRPVKIMLRSEIGVYKLTNEDLNENYDGTICPSVGASATLFLKETKLGYIGLYAGIQSMFALLTHKGGYSEDQVESIYVLNKIGTQITSLGSGKISVSLNTGYTRINIVSIIWDSYRGDEYTEEESLNGAFMDFIISFKPLDKINLMFDGGMSILATGNKNEAGGSKFLIGATIFF